MKKFLTLIALTITIFSCQDDNAFSGYNASIVVEGWLFDVDTFQYVQLSQSQRFNDQREPSYVSTATVEVVSSLGETQAFKHQSKGTYISINKFAGQYNLSYQLRITLPDGAIVESATERMPLAPDIDSLSYTYYEISSDNDNEPEVTIYYPIAYALDEENVKNYYRYRLYRNGVLLNAPELIILLSDQFFDGNEFGNNFTDFAYVPGDSAIVELMEISKTAYNYLSELKSQTTAIGTAASVTPAAIPSNLRYINSDSEVLGLWGVASVKTKGIKILE